jgi:DNA-binding MarR family transcriptional regulator
MRDVTSRVRDFNRYYTQRIGVLTDRYLGQRPLGEARLLFELGQTGDVAAVRSRLGLDSGYLSRLLRSLERQGLVTVGPHPADARARTASLTAAGLDALSELDNQSDAAAASLIEPLPAAQRDELAAAMDTVQRLLRLAAVVIEPVPAGSAGASRCLEAYAAELAVRFPEGYGPQDLCPRGSSTGPPGSSSSPATARARSGAWGCGHCSPAWARSGTCGYISVCAGAG